MAGVFLQEMQNMRNGLLLGCIGSFGCLRPHRLPGQRLPRNWLLADFFPNIAVQLCSVLGGRNTKV